MHITLNDNDIMIYDCSSDADGQNYHSGAPPSPLVFVLQVFGVLHYYNPAAV